MLEFAPLIGWDAIAQATPYKPDTLPKLYKGQLIKAGVIVYRKLGRPPRRHPCAYPQDIMRFFGGHTPSF